MTFERNAPAALSRVLPLLLLVAHGCAFPPGPAEGVEEWRAYGGDASQSRYSTAARIDRGNVHRLRVAWEYHAGDPAGTAGLAAGQMQTNPLVVDGVLYGVSPSLKAFALDARNGREIWKFDPMAEHPTGTRRPTDVSRGLVLWSGQPGSRLFHYAGPRVYALDPATGRLLTDFGGRGWIDLREGLGRDTTGLQVSGTTPGVVYRDLLIQGSRVSEGEGGAPGDVRAYDVRTGAVRWTFHTIPRPGEPGHETWPADAREKAGGANSWAGMSVDHERGIVYVPTGSAAPDFYGGDRPGANLYANTLLALDAATGRRLWHFQAVHHDIWDRDLPAPPNLVTLNVGGRRVDAVAQITKAAEILVFDRATGEPLFPIEERAYPASTLRGESAWPTQPTPLLPERFARQRLAEADLTTLTPAASAAARERFRRLTSAGQFIPFDTAGTIVFPGFDGGGEWGGAAVDPTRGIMYVNASEMAWIGRMIDRSTEPPPSAPRAGERVYAADCASCHGADRRGTGDRGPSLEGLSLRRTLAEARQVVTQGAGFMPAFRSLPAAEIEAVVAHVMGLPAPAPAPTPPPAAPMASPYRFGGYERFLDASGYPAIAPPWGTLNAVDLNTGRLLWKVPLGEFPELTARGIPPTGTENYGGPIVTAGGVVFIAASKDEKIRAFDQHTGRVLWEARLPAGGYATPATYVVEGKQYVVIAAGGGKMGTRAGDSYVAFALPD